MIYKNKKYSNRLEQETVLIILGMEKEAEYIWFTHQRRQTGTAVRCERWTTGMLDNLCSTQEWGNELET